MSLFIDWSQMNLQAYKVKIKNTTLPLVVDFWAPWCGPCKAMDPLLTEIAQKYKGKVEVLKVNADQSPDVLKELGIMGIPTTAAYVKGRQVYRKTGFQPKSTLEKLFQELSEGKTAVTAGVPMAARIFRLVIGGGLIVFGALRGPSTLLIILGAVVAFTAVYDRCPIFKAVSAKIKTLFQKPNGSSI